MVFVWVINLHQSADSPAVLLVLRYDLSRRALSEAFSCQTNYDTRIRPLPILRFKALGNSIHEAGAVDGVRFLRRKQLNE